MRLTSSKYFSKLCSAFWQTLKYNFNSLPLILELELDEVYQYFLLPGLKMALGTPKLLRKAVWAYELVELLERVVEVNTLLKL